MKASKFQAAAVDAAFINSVKQEKTLREELLQILRHRKQSLDKAKPFTGKAPLMAATVQLINRFSTLYKCSDDTIRHYIRDEAARLLYLYGPETDFPKQRERIQNIVNEAIHARR